MTFRNPILGGGGSTLLRPAIQSPNYAPGVAGWSINQAGTAEFNDATFRGGTSVSSTSLYYSGTPAAGNLVASIAEAAGTDAYGNNYLAGVTVYNPGTSYAQLGNASLAMGVYVNGQPDPTAAHDAIVDLSPYGLLLASQITVTNPDASSMTLLPGQGATAVPGGFEPYALLVDTLATSVVSQRISGAVIATDITGTPYTWQTPTLGAGWAAGPVGGSFAPFRYRKDPLNNLVVSGTLHTTSSTPSSTICTLAAGYIPKEGRRPPISTNTGGTYAARSLTISTAGAVSVDPLPTAGNTDVYIEVSIPLGDLP